MATPTTKEGLQYLTELLSQSLEFEALLQLNGLYTTICTRQLLGTMRYRHRQPQAALLLPSSLHLLSSLTLSLKKYGRSTPHALTCSYLFSRSPQALYYYPKAIWHTECTVEFLHLAEVSC